MTNKYIEKILQINIVVKNVEKTIKNFEIYGVGPWTRDNGISEVLRDRTVYGRECDYEFYAAFANIGDIEIELIQPIDEKSDYYRFLMEHGEGIHHIAIKHNKENFKKLMTERNISILQSGYWEGFGKYTYYDTFDDLGLVLEVYDKEGE